jgi:4-hydroxybenzoate polyprenyltransferase
MTIARSTTSAKAALLHLRLPFSLVLMPLYLWGLYLAAPIITPVQTVVGFLAVHLLLYGGMNGFNSYYDQDEGPIGGLAEPPPVNRLVLALSLLCKGASLRLGWWVGPEFGALVLGAILLSILYSHRRFRWKERPLLALLTIFVGQGVFGVLWGWTAAGRPLAALGLLHGIGILGAALVTSGLYPLTGTYQIELDQRREIQTLAVWLGLDGSFRVGAVLSALGGLGLALVLAVRGAWVPLGLSAGWGAAATLVARRWRRRFAGQSPKENQGELMRLAYRNGLFFSLLFGLLLLMR